MPYSGHLLQSYYAGIPTNVTIAASMAGTASATQLVSSISVSHASQVRVFNGTLRNLEVIIGAGFTPGTADFTPGTATVVNGKVLFVPGTASATVAGGSMLHEMIINQGQSIWVRTTENTPITCASTTPIVIQLWA